MDNTNTMVCQLTWTTPLGQQQSMTRERDDDIERSVRLLKECGCTNVSTCVVPR